MKKPVGIVLVVLILVLIVTAYLNQEHIVAQKELEQSAMLAIHSNGQEVARLTQSQIRELGEEEFTSELKSSGKPARLHNYVGVPLSKLIAEAGLDLSAAEQVNVKAVDGYVVGFLPEEVLAPDNIYVVYEMDGDALGTKETGGSGPYQVIVRKDQFSQRWCKFVVEVDVR